MAQQIPLTKGLVALIDDEDSDLAAYKWCASYGYAFRKGPNKTFILMHRIILSRKLGRNLMPDEQVDHIDRNRANNTRSNLRVATRTQNMRNRTKSNGTSSRYLGVSWHKGINRWAAYITLNNTLKYLGSFNKELDAAIAYDLAAHWYFGEYANLNIGAKY